MFIEIKLIKLNQTQIIWLRFLSSVSLSLFGSLMITATERIWTESPVAKSSKNLYRYNCLRLQHILPTFVVFLLYRRSFVLLSCHIPHFNATRNKHERYSVASYLGGWNSFFDSWNINIVFDGIISRKERIQLWGKQCFGNW